ncbi:MAG: sigma 54-interacting transcriptional regulator [Myxococcaceae bacterium]
MENRRTRSVAGKLGELPPRLRLSAHVNGAEVAHLFVERGSVTVGSAPGNDLVVPDATVSRKHLEVAVRKGGLYVADLESRNGTRFQGSRIQQAYVPVGAVLVLGEAELRIEADEGDARAVFGALVSVSPVMMKAMEALKRVAPTDATVLLEAETGSGKEVTARAIHDASPRAGKTFETVDCGALPRELAGSELFGHAKGAFTGAERTRPGAFERADGGTLFLDEIGELPLELQPLLLRALENRQVRRVGDDDFRAVDVRVIAATNRDLDGEVKAGRFRADLLHRLAVVRVRVPPLRERLEDLPILVRSILDRLGPRARGFSISGQVLERFKAHRWPGNVRELRNLIERAAAMGDQPQLDGGESAGGAAEAAAPKSLDYHQARETALLAFERDFIVHVLRTFDCNVSRAARESGIDRVYLHKLIKRHGIDIGRL